MLREDLCRWAEGLCRSKGEKKKYFKKEERGAESGVWSCTTDAPFTASSAKGEGGDGRNVTMGREGTEEMYKRKQLS